MIKTKKVVVQEKFKISGIELPISSNQAGECLMKIYEKNDGMLTPDLVVKEAKRKSHPLHKCFEWNDGKAAKAYRLSQAGKLIRCVVISKDN